MEGRRLVPVESAREDREGSVNVPPSHGIEQTVYGSSNGSETNLLIKLWLVVSLYCGPTAPKLCKRDCSASSEIAR